MTCSATQRIHMPRKPRPHAGQPIGKDRRIRIRSKIRDDVDVEKYARAIVQLALDDLKEKYPDEYDRLSSVLPPVAVIGRQPSRSSAPSSSQSRSAPLPPVPFDPKRKDEPPHLEHSV
jgi:hypothetical protein